MLKMQKPRPVVAKPENDSVFRIRQVDSSDPEGIDLVTELHMELLKFGPMARFGDRFIRETVYVPSMQDRLLQVAIAEVDGHPAGFIAYAGDAQKYYHTLMRNHFLKAVWVMGFSLLSRPARLRHLPRAFKVIFSRNEMPDDFDDTKTEVICFGVRPEYLTPDFIRRTNLRVGPLLLEHAFNYFRQNGFKKTRMIVDGDNPRALLFYQSMGAQFSPCTYGGVPSYVVLFDL